MGILDSLSGWKTYIGGAGFICAGIADILIPVYEGTIIDWNTALGLIFGGIAIIGGGHKLQKFIDNP